MRLKYDNHDPKSYRCCLCCHCRTGTLLLGLWSLTLNIFVIGFLLLATFHPNVLLEARSGCTDQTDGVYVDTSKGETEFTYEYLTRNVFARQWTKEDLCVAFALTVCTLMITLFLIYGTIKNRPGYLLPFFGLQVFSFSFSCLTVVCYFSYAPNIKLWLEGQCLSKYPGINQLMLIDEQWLMLLFVMFFILVLSIKAYFMGVVWACYKYLQMILTNPGMVREYAVDTDTEMLLPPKYDDVVKYANEQPPPYAET